MNTTITVALICHDDKDLYDRKMSEIAAWSRQPDELLIYASVAGWDSAVHIRPNLDDKGYDKRHYAYMAATQAFVYLVNYDNIHDFHVLEKLEEAVLPDSKVVYHHAAGKYAALTGSGSIFKPFNSGCDNFMVSTALARQLGGYAPFIGNYCAGNMSNPPDGKFIAAINKEIWSSSIEYIPETLVVIL